MPAYRGYNVSEVRWRDYEWNPDRCNCCDTPMNGSDNTYFYDIQSYDYRILDEDVAYCSRICCQLTIDRMISENGALVIPRVTNSYSDSCRKEEMQEEETED